MFSVLIIKDKISKKLERGLTAWSLEKMQKSKRGV